MKNKFTILAWFIGTLWSAKLNGQSISPDPNGTYCPYQTITFGVTLPVGNTWSSLSVSGYTLNITGSNGIVLQTRPANVATQPANIMFPGGTSTTFTFTGSFNDDNTPQSFRVLYVIGGVNNYYDVTYYKVESFATQFPAYSRPAAPPSVSVPRCQTTNFNINFPNVVFVNNNPITNNSPSTVVKYGTITQYEYLLPVNWSLGGTASNGTDWITGTSNVNITPDLSHGDGSYILIRPVHPCGPGLAPAPQAQVAISRPAPTLTITSSDGSNSLCSGTKNFTINGMPAGATVAWTMTNPSVATIPGPPNNTSSTITVTRMGSGSGVAVLKATVTHCSFTYPVSINVLVGGPSATTSTRVFTTGTQSAALDYCNILTNLIASGTYNGYVNINDAVATSINWVLIDKTTGAAPQILLNPDPQHVEVRLKPPGAWALYQLKISNSCGLYSQYVRFMANVDCLAEIVAPPIESSSTTFSVNPNPSQNFVMVESKNKSIKEGSLGLIYSIKILDDLGTVRKIFDFKSGVSSAKIPLQELSSGIYVVSVFDGKKWNSHKLLVQK